MSVRPVGDGVMSVIKMLRVDPEWRRVAGPGVEDIIFPVGFDVSGHSGATMPGAAQWKYGATMTAGECLFNENFSWAELWLDGYFSIDPGCWTKERARVAFHRLRRAALELAAYHGVLSQLKKQVAREDYDDDVASLLGCLVVLCTINVAIGHLEVTLPDGNRASGVDALHAVCAAVVALRSHSDTVASLADDQ